MRVAMYFCKVFVALWLTLLGHGVWASTFLIVQTERSSSFTEAEQALVAELERSGVARSEVQSFTITDVAQWDAASASARWIITMGADALRYVLSKDVKAPVLATLLPRSGFERVIKDAGKRPNANLSAVFLDQPTSRQLDLLRIALPQAQKVGVLLGAESSVIQPTLAAQIQTRGLDMVVGTVPSGGMVFTGLKTVVDDADVLLAVADPNVFNGFTISNILLTTYRARIPVVAFSPAYVKAGALMALFSTPTQAGQQTGQMLRFALQTGGFGAPQYPTEFAVSVNEHVARSMGFALDAVSLQERLRRLEKRQ